MDIDRGGTVIRIGASVVHNICLRNIGRRYCCLRKLSSSLLVSNRFSSGFVRSISLLSCVSNRLRCLVRSDFVVVVGVALALSLSSVYLFYCYRCCGFLIVLNGLSG